MTEQLTRRELCKFIYDNIPNLDRENLLDVFKQVRLMIPLEKFIKNANGTLLSLDDTIPDDVIIRFSNLIQSKLSYAEPDQE